MICLLTGTMFRLTFALLSVAEQGHPFCYYALQRACLKHFAPLIKLFYMISWLGFVKPLACYTINKFASSIADLP